MHHNRGVANIQVICSEGTKNYQIDLRKAVTASGYFYRRGAEGSLDRPFLFHVDDSDPFELFCNWVQNLGSVESLSDDRYFQEPWLSKTAAAWVLAQQLEAPSFALFCFEKFIQNCSLAPFGPWEFIEKNTKVGSPLRRFSNHWVAWNVSLLTGTRHEYVGLQAARLCNQVNEYTGDPREYNKAHWYESSCGDYLASRCDHNPSVVRERARLAQILPAKPPPRGDGRSIEQRRKRIATKNKVK